MAVCKHPTARYAPSKKMEQLKQRKRDENTGIEHTHRSMVQRRPTDKHLRLGENKIAI